MSRTICTFVALAISLVCGSCAATPVGLRREALAIPGPWVPPPSTLAISNPLFVDVVGAPPVRAGECPTECPDGDVYAICSSPSCSTGHPGTRELTTYVRERYPYVGIGTADACRRNSNRTESRTMPGVYPCQNFSVHSIGRAIDFTIREIDGDADNSAGDPIANWLIENAEYIGIQRVIWDGVSWRGDRPGRHFTNPATDPVPGHTNHIHVELSEAGAARLTPFFMTGPPRCALSCDGTDVVHEDCSRTSCTVPGEVCLPDVVRCGSNEPAEALRSAAFVPPAVSVIAPLARFQATEPTRLFDTRAEETSRALTRSDGATSGPLGATRTGTLALASIPGLPAASSSLWLNVTAVPIAEPGFVSAYPAGAAPATSTVNYAPARVRANGALVTLGEGGVSFAASSDVHVIGDMTAAFAEAGLGLRTAGPRRVHDTRVLGSPLVPGVPVSVDVEAPPDARAVVANVTVVQPGPTPGFVTAYPCGTAVPSTSSVNFAPTSVAANTVMSALGDGRLCVASDFAVHLIVDVVGFLVADGELSYQALSPARWLDTRQDTSLYAGRLGVGQIVELPIQSAAGMPADVRAVTVNLTTLSPGQRGFLTAFPCGTELPTTSNLNFDADTAIAAVSVTALGSGSLCVFASARTHLIVDLVGVWVPTPGAPPPTVGPGPIPDVPEDPFPDPADTADSGGSAPDGSVTRDAGTRPPSVEGCSCRVAGAQGRGGAKLDFLLAAALALGLGRSRRARSSAPWRACASQAWPSCSAQARSSCSSSTRSTSAWRSAS